MRQTFPFYPQSVPAMAPHAHPFSFHSAGGPVRAVDPQTPFHVPVSGESLQQDRPFSPAPYAGTAGPQTSAGWFDFSHAGYLRGILIGTGAALVLTNPAVQKALVFGTVKIWSLFQSGMEEVKEQFRDVNAEMSQEK